MRPDVPTDPRVDALIARAQAGDEAAFDGLYVRFRQIVFRFLYYRVGDTAGADDLTSDVFMRVARALPGYRRQRASFQAWLLQIARNLAIDHYRRNRSRPQSPLDEGLAAAGDELDHVADQRLTHERLRAALGDITEEQREVVVLRFVAGCSTSEVAAIVGKSETAVKALQRRGLEKLRARLEESQVSYD